MDKIGLYRQVTDFTTQHAGTAEWCKARCDGKLFFVKKFQSPVYPSKDIGLPERMYNAGVAEFKDALAAKKNIYQRLRECNHSNVLVIPLEVINFQFHICTVAEYVDSNVSPEQVCELSEWQRLVLMRTLTLALMNVHEAGVVHSDMRPDNVLIMQDAQGHCRLRLIDFDGGFLESDPPTDPEEVVGDPIFFAPEAYRMSMEAVRLDHRIDIFALGIIFHYFWRGKYPRTPGSDSMGVCRLRGEPVEFDESVPLPLKQLMLRMTSADPEDRLNLKSVYDVLGIQLALYPPEIINLQKNPVPPATGQAEIRVNCVSESGWTLKSWTLCVPCGTKQTIVAEPIDGFKIVGPTTKEVAVDSEGHAESPVVFTYQVEQEEKKEPDKKRWFWTGVIIFLVIFAIWVIINMGGLRLAL